MEISIAEYKLLKKIYPKEDGERKLQEFGLVNLRQQEHVLKTEKIHLTLVDIK